MKIAYSEENHDFVRTDWKDVKVVQLIDWFSNLDQSVFNLFNPWTPITISPPYVDPLRSTSY